MGLRQERRLAIWPCHQVAGHALDSRGDRSRPRKEGSGWPCWSSWSQVYLDGLQSAAVARVETASLSPLSAVPSELHPRGPTWLCPIL